MQRADSRARMRTCVPRCPVRGSGLQAAFPSAERLRALFIRLRVDQAILTESAPRRNSQASQNQLHCTMFSGSSQNPGSKGPERPSE